MQFTFYFRSSQTSRSTTHLGKFFNYNNPKCILITCFFSYIVDAIYKIHFGTITKWALLSNESYRQNGRKNNNFNYVLILLYFNLL